jgi:PIN domain nuclease of toxin-antitoxin system
MFQPSAVLKSPSRRPKESSNCPVRRRSGLKNVVEYHGLAVLPLELNVCIAAAQLPPIHDDPCDRFIIATAKLNDLAVVTADERFEEYGLTVLS